MATAPQMRMMPGGMTNTSQDAMMHGRYGNQMPQQRPPHDQYGQYPGGQGYAGQYPGYPGQQGYGAQKGTPTQQQQRDMYASQQAKGYGEFARRDGYNMSASE